MHLCFYIFSRAFIGTLYITCHSCLTTDNYLLRIYACVYVILGSKISEVTAPAMVQISKLFVCNQQIARTISCMSKKLRTDIKKLAKIYNLQFIIFPDNPGKKSLRLHNFFSVFLYTRFYAKLRYQLPPPLFPPPFNVEVGVRTGNFFIQFSTLNGVGVGEGGVVD